MSDQTIWICFEPINYPVPRILHGASDPNGDKDVYVPYVPAERIEQLERELSDGSFYKETTIDALIQGKEAAESKLAKAMEVLRFYAYGHTTPPTWHRAHAVLAEIEGDIK